jgi:hypothetical protein
LPDVETVYKDFGFPTGGYPQSLVQTKYGEFYGSEARSSEALFFD